MFNKQKDVLHGHILAYLNISASNLQQLLLLYQIWREHQILVSTSQFSFVISGIDFFSTFPCFVLCFPIFSHLLEEGWGNIFDLNRLYNLYTSEKIVIDGAYIMVYYLSITLAAVGTYRRLIKCLLNYNELTTIMDSFHLDEAWLK